MNSISVRRLVRLGAWLAGIQLTIAWALAQVPVVSQSPINTTTTSGQPVTFSVAATGPNLTYQWRFNGMSIAGATATTFRLPSATMDDAGTYDVVVMNPIGAAISSPAVLGVQPTTSPSTMGIDPTFAPLIETAGGFVGALLTQPDGKVIVGGQFVRINGVRRRNLARLNVDGTVDSTFNLSGGTDGTIYSLALQADGKVVIGGDFLQAGGATRNRIARLNADGSLDTTFNSDLTSSTGIIYAVAVLSDGRIMAGGSSFFWATRSRRGLVRLSATGTVDVNFGAGDGVSGLIFALTVQPDGRLLAGGPFSAYDGTARSNVVRLRTDGSIDSTFIPALSGEVFVRSLAVQSDGKVVVGSFSGITRLNADGALDSSFLAGGASGTVLSVVVLPDGRILAGGGFQSYAGNTRSRLARINTDGTCDQTFVGPAGINDEVWAVAATTGGKVFAGGRFSTIGSSSTSGVLRLQAAGTIDPAGPTTELRNAGLVYALLKQRDGQYIVGGDFDFIDGASHPNIARLTAAGVVDSTFTPSAILANGSSLAEVRCAVLQSDGKILFGGSFDSVNGVARSRIARLNADGSLDTTFDPGSGANSLVLAIAVQADGLIYIGGAFTTYAGQSCMHFTRLTASGAVDPMFPARPVNGTGSGWVSKLVAQPDGKILIAGDFTIFGNVVVRCGLVRVYGLPGLEGAVDGSFDASATLGYSVGGAVVAPDGKIYVASNIEPDGFTTSQRSLVRLTSTGARDTTFSASQSRQTVDSVGAMLVQTGVGVFAASRGGSPSASIARFGTIGAVDSTFSVTGLRSGATTNAMVLLDNGNLVLGGNTFSDGRVEQYGLARLAPVAAPRITSSNTAVFVPGTTGSFQLATTGVPAPTYSVASGTLPTWAALDSATGTITGTPPTGASAPSPVTIRATNGVGTPGDQILTLQLAVRPAITRQPVSASVAPGNAVTLTGAATGTPAPTYQWRKNGVDIAGATSATLTLNNVQPADVGVYTYVVTNVAATVTSDPAVVGIAASTKLTGPVIEVAGDIELANGNIYDQLLLTGAAASVTADPGQVTRISFLDLTDDIVQVEFSGPGTLTLQLDNAKGPVAPEKYNQTVTYMKGHPTVALTGATANTHLSIFSVGRGNAANQALFYDGVTYDGFADIALVTIASSDGKFGGLRTANGSYFATRGLTGVQAPGVLFTGPVWVNDIAASGSATPVLLLGGGEDVRITGGDLFQPNGRAVQVSGIAQLKFEDGSSSHRTVFPAQPIRGRLEQNGVDVTDQIAVPPRK